jgi:RND family efflux transporter MFP subunit
MDPQVGERREQMKAIKTSVGMLLAAMVMVAGCSRPKQDDPRTQPPLVRVTTLSDRSAREQSFTGVVTARVQSDLGFRVPGKVIARFVDVGQTVRARQPLMRIDNTDYVHEIAAQTENVRAAKARAEQAAADEARYRGLVGTGAVSASAYDQVKATADSSQAQLAAAQAQEQIARDRGGYSLLLADSDGTVVQTMAEPGQVVAAGQTVVKLAHAGPREAAVYLPETLRPDSREVVRATLYAAADSVPARLRQLSNSADPNTRTFEARYVLQRAGEHAPLGATVTLRIPLPGAVNSVAVPNAAITDRGDGPGVWTVNSGTSTVSFRPVTIVRLGEEETSIKSNIGPEELVVALGAHLLRAEQRVRIAGKETTSRCATSNSNLRAFLTTLRGRRASISPLSQFVSGRSPFSSCSRSSSLARSRT